MIIRSYEDHRRICIQVIIKACATEFKLSNPSKTATIDDVKDTNDKSAINELILVNDEKQRVDFNEDDIESLIRSIIALCDKDKFIKLVGDICDHRHNSQKWGKYKQSFVSWINQNDINGEKFLKYNAIEFTSVITTMFGDRKVVAASYNLYRSLLELNIGLKHV